MQELFFKVFFFEKLFLGKEKVSLREVSLISGSFIR